MKASPRSQPIDTAQGGSEAGTGRLIPTDSGRTSPCLGRAAVSPKARIWRVRSNGQDDIGERASLIVLRARFIPSAGQATGQATGQGRGVTVNPWTWRDQAT